MQYFFDADASRKPGDPVLGYRIHYRTHDGKLYSPFMLPFSLIGEYPEHELEIDPTGVNHSLTEHGYYYWVNAKQAEEYLNFALHKKVFNSSRLPKGEYVIQRVLGIEAEDSIGREGNIMEDMQILDTYIPNS